MPRGDKSKYTGKQDRKADHIAESYELRGVPEQEAERIAWATVNKESGGGKKSGSGRGRPDPRLIAKRRPAWRPSIGQTASGRAFSRVQEGRGDAQAPCFVVNTGHHDRAHSPNRSARMELWFRFAIGGGETVNGTVKETTKCFPPF